MEWTVNGDRLDRVVHVVPHFPFQQEALGDQAGILGRRLREWEDGPSASVYVGAGWKPVSEVPEGVRGRNLTDRRDADVLHETLVDSIGSDSRTVVLVQYSGYGYAPSGAPGWLVDALSSFRESHPDVPVATMFHELYAMGAPWRKSFWYSPFQRRVAIRLAALSDGVMTNRFSHREWLFRHVSRRDTPVYFNPIFSNVGEPDELPAWDEREPSAVLFGRRKEGVYRGRGDFRSLLERLSISRVEDVGLLHSGLEDRIRDLPVEPRGILPAGEISRILSRASLGLLAESPVRLPQSSVAAAYLAHGVPVLLFTSDDRSASRPYTRGEHFRTAAELLASEGPGEILRKLGAEGRRLYRRRLHSRHAAERTMRMFERMGPGG